MKDRIFHTGLRKGMEINMNNEKMGQFISELRKSKQMTQKELAEKLNISDKAVSKWERGLSCPDISLLSPLAGLLGVTTTDLLNGERADSEAVNVETVVESALEYGEKAGKRRTELNLNVISAAYTIMLLIGIFVVVIVDVASSRALTWSLIPIISCVFAWVVFIPALKLGAKGIVGSLIAATVFIIPFLYLLEYVIERLIASDVMLFSIGIRVAPLAIAFIWMAYLLFRKFKARMLLAVAIIALLSSPISFFINAIITSMLEQQYSGLNIVLTTFIPVLVAALLFGIEIVMRRAAHT